MELKLILLTGMGFVFLGLGAVGLFLPIWPTTPFVILSAACFTVTPRLRKRIMSISFFREHIENYETRNGLSAKTVLISLAYLWGMLLLSAFCISKIELSILLAMIGITVTIHILWISQKKGKDGQDK